VSASGDDGNVPANVLDNLLTTRWSNLGRGSQLTADLGTAQQLDGAAIAWYRGNERVNSFELSTSADGTTFTPAFTGKSSGTTTAFETSRFTARQARWLRLTFTGNTKNDWASVTELKVCGTAGTAPAATTPATTGWIPLPRGTIRVRYPKGKLAAGAFMTLDVPDGKRYRLRYEVMPEGNFDFRAGGKLPGFAGGSGPAGGSTATNGWSGRLMWNQGGRLSFYFYRVAGGTGAIDTGGYGTHWMWASDAKLIPGRWNTIEVLVDVNTGETVGYLNGVEKARQRLTYLWKSIDYVMFSTFFGGQGTQYQPVKDEFMGFRNMMVKPGG
jgi:hypothetical protein